MKVFMIQRIDKQISRSAGPVTHLTINLGYYLYPHRLLSQRNMGYYIEIQRTPTKIVVVSPPLSHALSQSKVDEAMQQMHYTNLAAAIMMIEHAKEKNGNVVPYLAFEDFRQYYLEIPTVYIVNSLVEMLMISGASKMKCRLCRSSDEI